MKCCRKEYAHPSVIDGTAYFVCSECGEVKEVENYKEYTPEELISKFESEYKVKLPRAYISLAGKRNPWVFKLPPSDSKTINYYFGNDFYHMGTLAGLEPLEGRSIFDSSFYCETWGLPDGLVLIEGDGHTWLALDYRKSNIEPAVILIETDEFNYLVVGNNFDEFINGLLDHDEVYDYDGNIVYKPEST